MIEVLGGQTTPATGFGMGYSTVALLLKEKGILKVPDTGPDFFVARVAGADINELVLALRRKYRVEYDLNNRNLGNQMKYANSIGAKKVIVVGPEELKAGKVKVRDMKTGRETKARLDSL
jgi:histidyl-tRNA synthetase